LAIKPNIGQKENIPVTLLNVEFKRDLLAFKLAFREIRGFLPIFFFAYGWVHRLWRIYANKADFFGLSVQFNLIIPESGAI